MKRFILLIITCSFLSSCEYFTLMSNKEWMEKSGNDKVAVYACGYVGAAQSKVYWKNDAKPVYLEDADTLGAAAEAIFVYERDVYVAGADNSQYACYWKNGKKVQLKTSGIGCSNAISVNGGTVYNAGEDNSHACLWINNEKFNLTTPETANSSYVTSIFVEDTGGGKHNIIMGGCYNILGILYACYWTGGGSDIFTTSTNPIINSVFLYKGNVYSVDSDGNCWINETNKYNGLPSLTSIYVYEDNIYMTGGNTNVYKNGTLLFTYTANELQTLKVFNNDIYAGGRNGDPCYWINNSESIYFDTDGGGSVYLTSLFVT